MVVKCYLEKNVYGIRPVLGGPEKWVNRKLLVDDPREGTPRPLSPLASLPLPDVSSESDSSESTSLDNSEVVEDDTSSDEDLVLIPDALFNPRSWVKGDEQPLCTD